MSIAVPLARSTFFKEAFHRSLSSSRILIKARVLGTKIQDSFNFATFSNTNQHNNTTIRFLSTHSQLTKEEKKEKRKEVVEKQKKSVLNFGHKFNQMGGPKVVIAYFGLELLCIGGFYTAFKAGLVSPDTIVSLMDKWEFTARFSHIIANNPNASLFTLAYASTKAISPIRLAIITAYGTYVVKSKKEALHEGIQHCKGDGCGCGKGHGNGHCGKHGEGECCGKGHGEGGCCGKHGEGECCGKGHGEGGCCGKHGEGECCGKGHGNGHCGKHGEGECCGKGHGEGGCCGKHGEGECCGKGHGEGGCCGKHGEGECCGKGHGEGGCCGKHGEGECCGKGHGNGHCKEHGESGCCGKHKHGHCKTESPSECLVGVKE